MITHVELERMGRKLIWSVSWFCQSICMVDWENVQNPSVALLVQDM
jgi:hypothetical protein